MCATDSVGSASVVDCNLYVFLSEFSKRAGGRRNSLATSHDFAAYFD